MKTASERDVVIVGGGHAGLMLGAALARLGFRVALIERQTPESIMAAPSDGRTLALLAGSIRIARHVGVWSVVEPVTAVIEQVEVVDVSGGRRVHYDSALHGRGPFGAGVEHVRLRCALLEAFRAAAGPGAFVQGEVAALHREGTRRMDARLADGRMLCAPLLVGADGRGSRVRELARIGVERWAYGQDALTFVVRHDRPSRGTVREWLRRGGPLAILPLPDRRTGVTWVEPTAEARRLAALGRPDLADAFTEATGGHLGRATIESGPSVYPLGAQHALSYVAPRLALVGDAAHGVHPIHAQGFNMGIADIGALVDALAGARSRGLDLGSGEVLRPYARARRPDNTQRLWLTDSMVRLFTTDLPPLRAARGLALAALERVTPLKRLAVRHGMQTG